MPVRPGVCQNSVDFPDCSADLRMRSLECSSPRPPVCAALESLSAREQACRAVGGGVEGGRGGGWIEGCKVVDTRFTGWSPV